MLKVGVNIFVFYMEILLTGSLSVDQITNFDGLFEEKIRPDKLHILSISVLLKELKRTHGGIAGNIAYSLTLLGEKPIILASIGEDQREYMDKLAKMGAQLEHLHYSKLPTATFSVITDRNDCQVGGFYPGAMGDASSLSLKPFAGKKVFTIISAHDPDQMAKQIAEAQSQKMRLFFDVGQQVIALPKKVLQQGIETAELLILNDYELGVLAQALGKTETQVLGEIKTCVVTLGEKGSKIYTNDPKMMAKIKPGDEYIPAVKIENAIDPTGAGDAYRAGFVYGYVRNWPLPQCAKLGSAVASFAIEKVGAQEHHFTLPQLSARYTKTYSEKLAL